MKAHNSTLNVGKGFKKTGGTLRRTKIRTRGKSETARCKENIQALLREIVILRDGGCIARNEYWHSCSGHRADGELILQADHLLTRANSATYADSRLVVCVCKGLHGWKSVGSNRNKEEYDALIRTLLPKDRVELWDRCAQESWRADRKYTADWKLAEAALRQELKASQSNPTNT